MLMFKSKKPRSNLKERELAHKFIAEEMKTKKYSRKQAVAIGLSRARAGVAKTKRGNKISAIMKRYR